MLAKTANMSINLQRSSWLNTDTWLLSKMPTTVYAYCRLTSLKSAPGQGDYYRFWNVKYHLREYRVYRIISASLAEVSPAYQIAAMMQMMRGKSSSSAIWLWNSIELVNVQCKNTVKSVVQCSFIVELIALVLSAVHSSYISWVHLPDGHCLSSLAVTLTVTGTCVSSDSSDVWSGRRCRTCVYLVILVTCEAE